MPLHDALHQCRRRREDCRILNNELLFMGALGDDDRLLPHELTLEARLTASSIDDTEAADLDGMIERLLRIHVPVRRVVSNPPWHY